VKDNNGSTIGERLKGWLGDCEELVRVRPGFIVAFAEDEIRAATAKLEAENAELRRQLEEPRGSRCYDCGGSGCESCELTGDAGTQVLRLKNRAHDLEVKLEEARGEAHRTVYVVCDSESDAVVEIAHCYHQRQDAEESRRLLGPEHGEHVYAVTLTARRVTT